MEPRVFSEITLTKTEYITARLVAARRNGGLWSMMLVGAVSCLLLLGVWMSALHLYGRVQMAMVLFFVLQLPVLWLIAFWFVPMNVRQAADRDYGSYQRLSAPCRMSFTADAVLTETPAFCMNDPYALMSVCIETTELVLFFKDDEQMLVLPKRCIPPDENDEFLDWLKQTFARKRRTMAYWML